MSDALHFAANFTSVVRVAGHEVRARSGLGKLFLDEGRELLPGGLVRLFLNPIQIHVPVGRNGLANVKHNESREVIARDKVRLMQCGP